MSSERVQGRVEVPAVITCTSPLFLWLETFQFCCFSSFQEDSSYEERFLKERLGIIASLLVLLDFYEFVDVVRGIF